jgi:hypothetical protein
MKFLPCPAAGNGRVRRRTWLAAAVLIMSLTPGSQAAVTLDWDVVDWTQSWPTSSSGGASVSQTFNNVQGSGVNVTITLLAGPNTATSSEAITPGGSNSNPLPDDLNGSPLTNGGSEQALMIDANFSNYTNDYITVQIGFSTAVRNVSFNLWDIDYGNSAGFFFGIGRSQYRDVVSSIAADLGVPADLTLASLGGDVTVSGNTLVGVATNGNSSNPAGNENDTTSLGTGNLNFGSQAVTSVSFRYSSNYGGTGTDPTLQRIALHDISFNLIAVPEPSACGLMLVTGVVGLYRRRRR